MLASNGLNRLEKSKKVKKLINCHAQNHFFVMFGTCREKRTSFTHELIEFMKIWASV